jgi:hypothetical protein
MSNRIVGDNIDCPFVSEFGKWIECPHLDEHKECEDNAIASGGSWCATMVGRAMLAHKTWIGNDY